MWLYICRALIFQPFLVITVHWKKYNSEGCLRKIDKYYLPPFSWVHACVCVCVCVWCACLCVHVCTCVPMHVESWDRFWGTPPVIHPLSSFRLVFSVKPNAHSPRALGIQTLILTLAQQMLQTWDHPTVSRCIFYFIWKLLEFIKR